MNKIKFKDVFENMLLTHLNKLDQNCFKITLKYWSKRGYEVITSDFQDISKLVLTLVNSNKHQVNLEFLRQDEE